MQIWFWGVVNVSLMSMSFALVFMLYRTLLGWMVSPVSIVVWILRPATGILFCLKVLLGRFGVWWGSILVVLMRRMSRSPKWFVVSLPMSLWKSPLLGALRYRFMMFRMLLKFLVVSRV